MSQWQGDPYGAQPPPGGGQATPGFGNPDATPPPQPQPGGYPQPTQPQYGYQQPQQPFGYGQPQPQPQQQPPFGQPGFQPGGYPPPPKSGGGGVAVAISLSVVAVLAIAGGVIFLMHKGNGHATASSSPTAGQSQAAPSGAPSATTPSPSFSMPSDPASSPPSSGGGGSMPADVLSAQVKTAFGDTFTRLRTRSGTCTSVAETALKKVLSSHQCIAPILSGLYTNAAKTAQITVTIMKFNTAADAKAVAKTAQTKRAYPSLMTSVKGTIPFWYYDEAEGQYVVYAHSMNPSGGSEGAKGGAVFNGATHLGAELRNVLIWD